MVKIKKCVFLGPEISDFGPKIRFCYTTPNFVNGPFVALRETIHFAPWDLFFESLFTFDFVKKKKTGRRTKKSSPTPLWGHRLPITGWLLRGLRVWGFEGVEGDEAADGADGSDMAAIYIYCHMVRTSLGKGYMALWGFQGIVGVDGWVEWMIPLSLLWLLEHLRC